MSANKELILNLEKTINEAAAGLPKVTVKKMFGCHALFANDNVFGLVWKHGQIGVKLSKAADYDKLLAKAGSAPWKAGPMQMKHWVLVPQNFNNKVAMLKPWVKLAHEQALAALPKANKKKSGKSKKI